MSSERTPSAGPGASAAAVKALLLRHGLSPRKSLGQNFLVDHAALLRSVAAAGLSADDTVVEVGPGPGLLTRELLARAGRVIAVEKDEGMVRLLREELGADSRLSVVEGDMLEVAPETLLALARPSETRSTSPLTGEVGGPRAPYKVVANLPYYVAAPILRRFLESAAKPRVMVVLLQREVAENIAAPPGDMGLLAVAVQYYAIPRLMGIIRAGSFYPAPKVDSAILRLDVREQPAVDVPAEAFFRVVKAALGARRKQIVNPLAAGLGLEKSAVFGALERAGIVAQRRAETLSLPEWQALCHALEGILPPGGEERASGEAEG